MKRSGMAPGFSLVELMVTVALVMLILGLFTAYTGSSTFRLEAAAQSVFAAFQKARMEAIMRSGTVSLSFDADDDGAVDNELTIWIDDDGNNAFDSGTETLIAAIAKESQTSFGSVPGDAGGPSANPDSEAIPADGVSFGGSLVTGFNPDGTATPGWVFVRSANNPSTGTYAIQLTAAGLPHIFYFQPGAADWKER